MARLSNATAVYLGNRLMITANHVISNVGNSPVTFTDGREFNSSVGSDLVLTNPPALQIPSTTADLKMFRLAADPGLPALQIDTASPTSGAKVMMIGAGRDREPNEIGWSISSTNVWTQTPLPFANARGFAVDSNSSHMRWGTNLVVSGNTVSNGNTATFATRFDSTGNPFEAQAVSGDSGGGVFRPVDGRWELVGIMDTVQAAATGQPNGTAVFGEQSLSADLSQYRDQIESILNRPERLWQNQTNHFDVDHSGPANARDVLLLINHLQNGGARSLSGAPSASDPLLDVNGDGSFNILDLSQLINALGGNTANPAVSMSQNSSLVPEPSTGVLALLGILSAALVRRVMIARRKR
ncbi:MAG: trypsin-like peptidase domain-containing protein [Planctomycetia bacterium]|nr:trypsin-like peptidase domain-containing protein [Planctomycetia bacterium]